MGHILQLKPLRISCDRFKTNADRESLGTRSFRDDRGHYTACPLLLQRDLVRRCYDYAPGPCACSRKPPPERDRRSCGDITIPGAGRETDWRLHADRIRPWWGSTGRRNGAPFWSGLTGRSPRGAGFCEPFPLHGKIRFQFSPAPSWTVDTMSTVQVTSSE